MERVGEPKFGSDGYLAHFKLIDETIFGDGGELLGGGGRGDNFGIWVGRKADN